MKSDELRLGNLIIEDGKETEFNGDFYHWIDGVIKPIPLTEEWLLKLGFKLNSNEWVNWSNNEYENVISISQHKDLFSRKHLSFSFDTNGCRNMNSINIDIKYVHQLQNLYFALTGSELQVNVA